jgi:hypothetical protein
MLSPRMSLRDTSVNVASHDSMYTCMDGLNKRKRKRTSCRALSEEARSKRPLTTSIESVATDASVGESWQPVEIIAQTSHPQLLHVDVEETAVPEGESPAVSPFDVMDASKEADLKCQITKSLEGGTSEIPLLEDAVDVMTSVLLTAARIRIQAGKFGFKEVILGTTTNIAKIREYTEQWLVKLLFKVTTKRIAKAGAGCAGIGLQKA